MSFQLSAHSARRGTERSQKSLTPRRAGLRCALSQWRAISDQLPKTLNTARRAGFGRRIDERQALASVRQRDSSPARTKVRPSQRLLAALAFGFLLGPLPAQWIDYPTPGVPRTSDGKPDLAAACPRTSDGKPDLSGLWIMQPNRDATPNFPGCEPTAEEFANIGWSLKEGLPYQPWAAELVKARRAELRVHDPLSYCLPVGPVRLHTWSTPRKVIQSPGLVVILNELNASYRQIFTDGRPLPSDPNPSWNGYSSGKWDGDTLVVQTNGFRDGIWLDSTGNPLTDAAKLTERFRRVNFGRMEIEITVDDPKAYTKPWTIKLTHIIKLDTDLLDFVCLENEKDTRHLLVK